MKKIALIIDDDLEKELMEKYEKFKGQMSWYAFLRLVLKLGLEKLKET